ncbi:MAG: (4Fe-4S)-binding protein, partial [Candidatus Micrarchaeia archaeon]
IIDGPPGVGCPVMASMTGVDLVVAITEPTLSGMHDLSRVVELAKHFKLPLKVIINKFDLNPQMSDKIAEELNKIDIELVGRIPFSEEILFSVKKGVPFLEYSQGKLAKEIESLIENYLLT